MTLQQLRYVIKIVECGSISEAAKQLYISQPSLSNALKELEKEMGIEIFHRTARGISLTVDGREFLSYARQVMEQIELLEQRYLGKKLSKQLCAVSTQHYAFAVNAFVNLLRSLDVEEYEFTLRETRTWEIIEDVKNLRSELGILYVSDFNIIGACYPEGHSDCASLADDIRHLKTKVEAGTDQLITQLFFDNQYFYSFRDQTSAAGINVPIQAGIMPVVNKKQIERMVSLCGVKLPKKFITMMERYENNPIAMRDAGIAYAVDQIVDLMAQDVDGIHLYTMNNPYIAQKIYAAISTLLAA